MDIIILLLFSVIFQVFYHRFCNDCLWTIRGAQNNKKVVTLMGSFHV